MGDILWISFACSHYQVTNRENRTLHISLCDHKPANLALSIYTMTMKNPPMEGKVLCLDSTYVPECAKVMAQAFANSPAYTYVFQGSPEYRQDAIEWILSKNIHLMLAKCPTVLRGFVDPYGRVVCCFLWVPGDAAKLSTWDMMITAGLWQMPFRYGLSTYLRLVSLMDAMKSIKGDISSERTGTQKIMLQRMVVHPDYQGNGIGSTALKTVLDESSTGQDVYLDTQEERNVVFYQRLGWQVVHEQDYVPEDPIFRFRSWSLVRKSASTE